MKIIAFFVFLTVLCHHAYALNIAQISVSAISDNAINVSLNTEAVELYYFQSWQYSISGTTITVEACFIPGFGSTIAYLNNNFQIPIDTVHPQLYHLIVKTYYTYYDFENLEDMIQGTFEIPIATDIVLFNNTFKPAIKDLVFTNPSHGKIIVDHSIKNIWVFDIIGRLVAEYYNKDDEINLCNIDDGLYIVAYFKQSQYKNVRIILRKNY